MNNRISPLVQSQFPEFVQSEYPALIRFVELYFEFLELEKNPQDILSNMLAYIDIDKTLDEFIKKFEATYIDSLPMQIAGDKRLFIKHISDLYQSKGTEESFRLLFRAMFNEEIEMYYPKQQMLRTSDGRWHQRNSIKVHVTSGNAEDTIDKKLKIKTVNGVINTHVTDVSTDVNGVTELFIDKQFNITINPGDIVTGLDFSAVCLPTTAHVSVLTPGAGFHIGQVFDIDSVFGSGTKIKVTRVDAQGGIKRVAFISFGSGYQVNFNVTIEPDVRKAGAVNWDHSFTNGFIESVFITKVSYFESNYVDQQYSGELVGSVYSNEFIPDNAIDSTTVPATLAFTLGALCGYRGEYVTSDGFLSDSNMLQDGYFYQDFSYVIKTKQKLQSYAAIVKKLIHPAGTIMFGEMQIDREFDVSDSYTYAKVLANNLLYEDIVTAADIAPTFVMGSLLGDIVDNGENVAMNFTTTMATDLVGNAEDVTSQVQPALNDQQTITDVAPTFDLGPSLSDLVTWAEDLANQINTVMPVDNVTFAEDLALNIGLVVTADTQTVNDVISITRYDYVDSTYLASDYVGTVLI